jgi:hypothetical protein
MLGHIHTAVIHALRLRLATSPFAPQLAAWDDTQFVRRIFRNYRDGRGLRLSQFGQQLMQSCFKSYNFETGENEHQHAAYLLFLDNRAKLPYFWEPKKLVVYDEKFAAWLRLVGDMPTLVEIDTDE